MTDNYRPVLIWSRSRDFGEKGHFHRRMTPLGGNFDAVKVFRELIRNLGSEETRIVWARKIFTGEWDADVEARAATGVVIWRTPLRMGETLETAVFRAMDATPVKTEDVTDGETN